MPKYQIQKRTGKIVEFDQLRIIDAISKAVESLGEYKLPEQNLVNNLTEQII